MKNEAATCIMSEPIYILRFAAEYVGKLGIDWRYKILASPPIAFYGQYLGGDGIILALFYSLFCVDLVLGIIMAVKDGTYKHQYLQRWVVKFVTYTLCIAMVGALIAAINRSLFGVVEFRANFILDIFMTFLLAGEIISICDHLHRLGCPVPAVLMRLATRIRNKAESRIDGILEDGKDEEK